MSIEFLGHKKSLLQFLLTNIEREVDADPSNLADLFCGTSAVSSAFKRRGYRVIANDQLVWCSTSAEAVLLNDGEPLFEGVTGLVENKPNSLLGSIPYDDALDYLNALPPKEGFIYWNYSPASKRRGEYERRYFTEENAGRIDAVRAKIKEWEELLTRGERALLLWDLIRAANAVSNIAGTYGCYLKQWKERALQPLTLMRTTVSPSPLRHEVFCEDANRLAPNIRSSIIYADPPYTKRQYAAYYHVLETIAVGDEPPLEGSTGLRTWQDKASDYCYKTKAPYALEDLVSKLNCEHFFLSYNADGQIPHDVILEILSKFGKPKFFEKPYRRYKSSGRPHKGESVVERLYHLTFS
jgi:adenine-specific DNA-methyltransferase